jgi:alpha-galactosidase
MEFGLWFGPDSANDFAHWERDAATILRLHRELGVNYFKIDGVKARTVAGEANLRRFFDRVLAESAGRVVFDLDVTAETRPGYFGLLHVGPLFVENRYVDYHRYWPHHTLRNLWKLAHYVDPARLRMEFLNHARHADLYATDPLAPAAYSPAYLFATTMFANPLGWFEVSNLPARYFEQIAPLVNVWKQHRDALFAVIIEPIGAAPDGTSWTGFHSSTGYALVFRELNDQPRWDTGLPAKSAVILAGNGAAEVRVGRLVVEIPKAQNFLFLKLN